MKVTISDKKLFLQGFLSPLSKINDTCVINLENNIFNSTVSTSDSSIILNSSFKIEDDIETPVILNIPDLKKIIKVLECISSDTFTLVIDKNNISYNGTDVKFKYHLLEDNIISAPKINIKKLEELQFPVSFSIDYKSIIELLRGSTFATDSNKLYLYSENNKIIGDLTDKSRHNVDSFTVPISLNYNGPELQPLCLNFEIIRIISSVRVKQIECKINAKLGVILFEINGGMAKTKYIASSLIK